MSIEFYRDLLLVQSLEYKMKEHLSVIEEQGKRVQFLEKQIQMRQEESEHSEKSLKELQEKIKKCDLEHQQTATRVDRLTEDSKHADAKQVPTIERENQSAKEHRDAMETTLYELMEREEENKIQLRDHHTFLQGSKKSLELVRQESAQIAQQAQKQIDDLQQRVDHTLNALPPTFKTAYLQANKKHRFKSPLSFLEKQYCGTCRFEQDRSSVQEVEEGRALHFCSGCDRLLIPLNAQ